MVQNHLQAFASGKLSTTVSLALSRSYRAQLILISRATDEHVSVYAVLSIPELKEETLRSWLPRITVTIEAHAVPYQPTAALGNEYGPYHGPTRELLYAETLEDAGTPISIARGVGHSDQSECLYVAWRFDVFLGILQPCIPMGKQFLTDAKAGHRVDSPSHPYPSMLLSP